MSLLRGLELPAVVDRLHHAVHPGDRTDLPALIRDCLGTWQLPDGIPIMHVSTQAPNGRPDRHADWIGPKSNVTRPYKPA